jgi:hypothetical protein
MNDNTRQPTLFLFLLINKVNKFFIAEVRKLSGFVPEAISKVETPRHSRKSGNLPPIVHN